MDPAVLPTGRKGTARKTANTQKIAKAIEPRTTFTEEAKAIFAAQQEKILLLLLGTYFYVIDISFDKTHFICNWLNLSRFKMIITSG